MTRDEQRQFIDELCNSIKEGMLRDINRIPEDWGGHELRRWIVDRFNARSLFRGIDHRRLREYRNTVLVRNLV